MDERDLLVLGLLKSQAQHGYQINEFIETYLGKVTDMKKSTAYLILKRLQKEGYAEVSLHQEGNRPVRQVYSITEKGNEYFIQLLHKHLTHLERQAISGEIPFMLMDHLPTSEVISLLQERHQAVIHMIEELKQTHPHAGVSVDLAIKYRLALFETSKLWIEQTILLLQENYKG